MWLEFLFELQLIETSSAAIFLGAFYSKPNRKKMNKMYKQSKKIK